ncbi:hypothetical protein SAMN02745121_05798 [Nannocystis exedens]|uniref:Uncharacterized protein n=1 Tax=Nannocystis exedens TaxID=54 RepID=A0A1I2DYU5_9BACT|nr:hypothetical protein [Nannocystis exedens]PCC69151.1 hypothetical protein NAEX_02173 [Nannocystis exedens]SFE85557.1 hypothetical protein SAMN02745121_05798 [Nannocystis exedens]
MKRLLFATVLASACADTGDPLATNPTPGPSGTDVGPTSHGSAHTDADEASTSGSSSGGAVTTTTGPTGSSGAGEPTTTMDDESSSSSGAAMCLPATTPCTDGAECCAGLECGTTSLGQVCCGGEGIGCNTPNGEDCCGALLCIAGVCGYDVDAGCEPPCTAPPALLIEKQRLATIGGSFLGICGDANHTYGFHVPAANLPADDYSLEGPANVPVCEWHAAAIDIGMDWPASRDWLKWLIAGIASDEIQGIAEVIGSYDGVDVRYWSDSSGWSIDGVAYQGSGHDTWTHVSVYRSTTLEDHGILAGWTANGGP